jgi:hypothetical protein
MARSRFVGILALAIFLLAVLGCANPLLPKGVEWHRGVELQKLAIQEKWDKDREAKEKGKKLAEEDFNKGIRPPASK